MSSSWTHGRPVLAEPQPFRIEPPHLRRLAGNRSEEFASPLETLEAKLI